MFFVYCESGMNGLTVVNDTVAQSYDAVILQFAVVFMKRRCESICQRETCVIGGGLLEGAWQVLQSKVKPWTIFLLHAWKSITQTPVLNARETDPTQRWAFPLCTPPHTPRSSLPPHYARNPKLSSVCPVLGKRPSTSLSSFQFFGFCLFSFTALFSKRGCRTPVKDTGK